MNAQGMRWFDVYARLALATLGLGGSALYAQKPSDGFFDANIEHIAYERIVAGPNLPPELGLATAAPYYAADVALSGDGTRLWFVLYNHFQDPRHQVWSINTDGTGAQQSAIALPVLDPGSTLNGLFVRTDLDGDMAQLDSLTQFWRINGAGAAMQLMFDLVGPNYALSDGQQRVSDDGSLGMFMDRWQHRVFTVDLQAEFPSANLLASDAFFAYLGLNPRSLFGFDMSADGGHWYVAAENHFNEVGRNRYWLNHGIGTSAATRVVEDISGDEQMLTAQVQVTDDGLLFGYCTEAQAEITARCFLQQAGNSTRQTLSDEPRHAGRMLLADHAGRVYMLSDPGTATPYGYFQRLDGPARYVAGSQRLSGNPNPVFLRAQLSDNGQVLAAPTAHGVYVLHDGQTPPPDFPQMVQVLFRYDPTSDDLVVRMQVEESSDALERIYTLPLWRGMEPTRNLPEERNPLWAERSGGGVNWSTVFQPLDGSPGWYERRIPMDGKLRYLNADFQLRLVLVDFSGHRTSLYDVTPRPYIQLDGFEAQSSLHH